MTFTPIETQEAFEAALKERLERERSTMTKKFEGYTSPEALQKIKDEYESKIKGLNTSITENANKYADYDKQLAEKDAKISAYETNSVKMRIARENGLSYDAVDFLKGEDEKSIKESADALKLLLGAKRGAPPLASNESSGAGKESTKDESLRKMLSELRGE